MSTGVGVSPIGLGDAVVDLHPLSETGILWPPHKGGVVRVANGKEAVGGEDPTHFFECSYGVTEVLEDLVCVHHIEGVIGVFEGVGVTDGKAEVWIVLRGKRLRSSINNFLRTVNGDDRALSEHGG